jgi:serine/threonine-protein kinase
MPYLSGGTLKQRLTGTPLPWQEAVKILLPVARALDYAHRQGMIHRDVKPSNILITEDGDPLLTDFGVAKIIDDEATLDLTGTSATVGTPEYMAPEQVVSKSVDHRADIYSLGVVFYEMVTGRKLYTADTPMAVLVKHASAPLPRPTEYVRDLPERVEQLLFKALAKNPDDRYQSMSQFASALEMLLSGATPQPHVDKWPRQPVGEQPKAPKQERKMPVMQPKLPVAQTASKPWLRWWPTASIAGIVIIGLAVTAWLAFNKSGSGIGKTVTWRDGMALLYVPAGEFTMGNNGSQKDESPAHVVYLDAFWIYRTEVTNGMYELCVQAQACQPPARTSSANHSSYYGNSEYDDYPVIWVDWNQAAAYCEWSGGRLPTEAEWEKAARGTDANLYPWGNEAPNNDLLNYNNAVGETTRVGKYPKGASLYGALDMAGNVAEWVADWYSDAYYGNSPTSNPLGPKSGQYKVLRGGSWQFSANNVRVVYRGAHVSGFVNNNSGFRCAMNSTE